ncbi:MAG: substrate-binding domain-containing protein [Clostridiales bacterium]|jgi:phosphate transport system substrate-binding protein|nr:substrate-binding domain-containing protein [Clostridiales bacterium]
MKANPVSAPPPQNDYSDYDLISRIDGSTATIPLSEAALDAYMGGHDGLTHNTTPWAYRNLINKACDIAFCTYPSEDERELAARKGIELEIIPVVKEALVFLNNAENPVENLTHAQLLEVYTGNLTDWAGLGGAEGAIIPYQRPVNSGSQTLFLKLVMGETPPMEPPGAFVRGEMADLIDAVAVYDNAENALGYSMFYYVSDMYSYSNIRLLSVDGVKPTRESIAAGEYKFVTHYYAVIRGDTPEDHPAREFLRWMLSGEGQRVAQNTGYVTLAPMDAPAQPVMYPGATRENTAASNGTGGTERRAASAGSSQSASHYDFINRVNGKWEAETRFPNEETKQAVSGWIDEIYAQHTDAPGLNSGWDIMYNLISVWIDCRLPDNTRSVHTAVFNAETGKKLALSDLFFDGVNYIRYINEKIPEALERGDPRWFGEDPLIKRRFTGYPNDFENFFLQENTLCFQPDDHDPFLGDLSTQFGLFWIDIPLPMALSPYGGVSYQFEKRTNKQGIPFAVPVIAGSLADETINAKIQALAEKLTQEAFINPDPYHYYEPVILIQDDKLSVVHEGFDLEEYPRVDVSVITGEDVEPVDVSRLVGRNPEPVDFLPGDW